MAEEHRAPGWLVLALAGFFAAMAAAAALFWLGAALSGGGPGWVIARIGAGATALFAAMHIPAAIVGILLLQWRRPALPRTWRVALEAATLYFGLAVLVSLALNYMLASLIDDMMTR